MSMRSLVLGLALALAVLAPTGLFATTPEELNPAVLFFVNDPQELSFCDMNLLVDRNKTYHEEHKTVNESQVADFFRHVQEHGVPNAGTGENKIQIGYVVKNAQQINAVLVVKGAFEHAKVLEILSKHYREHSEEHAAAVIAANKFAAAHGEKAQNPYVEQDIKIDGLSAHVFPAPLANREFIALSGEGFALFSSAPRGERDLLKKTIAVMQGKLPLKTPPANSKVVMTFAATGDEKKQIEERVWARYDRQKQDSLTKKKFLKKTSERLRQKVIKSKVNFMMDAMQDMQTGIMTVDRGNGEQMTKTMTLVSTFASPEMANDVKARLVKHLVKEIKHTENVQDKFAMGNVSITTKGNQTVIRCQMRDSKEQLHVFNLISSYIAKGMLDRL